LTFSTAKANRRFGSTHSEALFVVKGGRLGREYRAIDWRTLEQEIVERVAEPDSTK